MSVPVCALLVCCLSVACLVSLWPTSTSRKHSKNTIGSLTWHRLCHYLHSIFGYSPTVRRVQWGCLFLHSLLIFVFSRKKKNFALFIDNARLIDDLSFSPGARSAFALSPGELSLALFHLLHLFRRQRRALSLSFSLLLRSDSCLLCARLRVALD